MTPTTLTFSGLIEQWGDEWYATWLQVEGKMGTTGKTPEEALDRLKAMIAKNYAGGFPDYVHTMPRPIFVEFEITA